MTFTVTVSECVEVSLGSTVMQINHNECVPVRLISTVGLTNLNFTLSYPVGRLTNWVLNATNTVIATGTVQNAGSGLSLVSIGTLPGQVLQGPMK